MSGIVYRSLGDVGADLVVLDARRRVYVGVSRDDSYLHLVHPTPIDLVSADGAVVRTAGQLVCTCKGSAFRGTCYRVQQAEAFEGTSAASSAALAWLRDPDPAEASA